MRKRGIISAGIILSFCSIALYAFSTGITGRTLKGNEAGCTCHASTPSSNVMVSIIGPDTLATNETATYTVTITGGPLVRAGTNIAASEGVLDIIDGQGLKKVSGELTHTQPKVPESGSVSFQFNYTSPATPGSVTLFANGNSVNFNGNNSGDQWNFAENKTINVDAPSDVDEEHIISNYKLEQNYPNPFNPTTNFEFQIASASGGGFVSLKIFDALGNEVTTLIEEERPSGKYKVEFNADSYNLSSGVYFYQLKSGNFNSTKKFILIK